MNFNFKYLPVLLVGGGLVLSSCTKDKDSPGYEYVPDMYRSQAIEAYVDYGLVADNEFDEAAQKRKNTISARKPAAGSIPFKANAEEAALLMPYPYANTDAGREEANSNAIPASLLANTEENLKEGKRLYGIFCSHCHGDKGKGDGKVVTVGDYNQPNPYDGGYKDRTPGSIFHTITYGKGAMGSHASQLNKIERWKVVMHVTTLQHGEWKPELVVPSMDTVPAVEEVAVQEVTE